MTAVATRQTVIDAGAADVRHRVHPAVARLHFGTEPLDATGFFDVRRGSGVATRLVAALLRLPAPARRALLMLHVERDGQSERWYRSFGGRSLDASFEHTEKGDVIEGFGPVRLHYRTRADRGALVLELASANVRLGPVSARLPRWVSPRVRARAWAGGDGLVRACIVVLAPWGGVLLAYRGFLDGVRPWAQ